MVDDPALKGGACRCPLPSRPRVWPVDNGPTGNVARSDGVGRPREATPDAPKGGLVRTIACIDPSTGGTGARRIPGIHQDDRHPGQCRLVFDKGPPLSEGPTMGSTPLRPSNRDPVTNPLEIVQSDSAPRVLGLRHHLFGDAGFSFVAKRCSLRRRFFKSRLADCVPVCGNR